MKEQKISTSMSLSGNYYEIKKNQTKKNNPVKFFLDFVFRFRTGIVSAAHLLVSTLAVIVSPSFITNGTVSNKYINIFGIV